jgi:hypothetical protein
MGIWNCGIIHNLMDDCAGTKAEEHQDYQDPYANPDECGQGYLPPLRCDGLPCLVYPFIYVSNPFLYVSLVL